MMLLQALSSFLSACILTYEVSENKTERHNQSNKLKMQLQHMLNVRLKR